MVKSVYLVGGAVRDKIMGVPVKDRDYVVVGGSPEEMIECGFSQVGADFPVFLHPTSNEEFALARTERKVGVGYHGFETDFSKEVTLEDDLFRRDLTMNAIAEDINYVITDPFNGVQDIKNKIIRHVSDFFADDPVRVLRVARFAARYSDFTIAPETINLCRAMTKSGELNHLTSERVALEMTKALSEKKPSIFFETLQSFGALEILFPELHALIGQTQPEKHHAEGDAFVHTMMVVDVMVDQSSNIADRFAALVHDLGKGLTPKEKLPKHHGHEEAGVPVVHAMCDRLKLSSEFREKGVLSARFHGHIHKLMELKEKTILKIFVEGGGKNKLNNFFTLARVSYADDVGRITETRHDTYINANAFISMMEEVSKVRLSDFFTPDEIKSMHVDRIREFIYKKQISAIKEIRKEWREGN